MIDRAVRRRIVLGVAVLLPWTILVGPAWAFFVEVEVIGKVQLGEAPRLIVTCLQSANDVVVDLEREDGKRLSLSLGSLKPETTREIALDANVGHHDYRGAVRAKVEGETVSSELSFSTVVASPISIEVDRELLDLAQRRLVFVASVPLGRAELKVIGLSGAVLESREFDLAAAPAGQPITVTWAGTRPEDILRLELRVFDVDGFFKGIALSPWAVTIPHEEVLFATNTAAIAEGQEDKLEASLRELKSTLKRFAQLEGVQLFIAGHTDTVGKPAHNAELSRRRAFAIAKWFVEHGIAIPVFFEGFGESSPKVKTGDEVDEPKNRRVDYILALEPPSLKSSAHAWKRLQ